MSMTVIVATIVVVLLAASSLMALVRIIRGPSILDRLIATDVLLASMITGFASIMVLTERVDLLPLILAIAMLGVVASISVSRYASSAGKEAPPTVGLNDPRTQELEQIIQERAASDEPGSGGRNTP